MRLPFAIQFAVLTDLALNGAAAVIGTDHGLIVQSQIAQFGVLVTAGIVLHELGNMVGIVARSIRRWRRRRSARHPGNQSPNTSASE